MRNEDNKLFKELKGFKSFYIFKLVLWRVHLNNLLWLEFIFVINPTAKYLMSFKGVPKSLNQTTLAYTSHFLNGLILKPLLTNLYKYKVNRVIKDI